MTIKHVHLSYAMLCSAMLCYLYGMTCHDTIYDVMWYDVISAITIYQSSPHTEAAHPVMCLCFRWIAIFSLASCSHFRANSPEKKLPKHLHVYHIYGKCPGFVALCPDKPAHAWPPGFSLRPLLVTLVFCCVFVSFIHFGSCICHMGRIFFTIRM